MISEYVCVQLKKLGQTMVNHGSIICKVDDFPIRPLCDIHFSIVLAFGNAFNLPNHALVITFSGFYANRIMTLRATEKM